MGQSSTKNSQQVQQLQQKESPSTHLRPFDREKGTPLIFTRINYINHITKFLGSEIYDAIKLASISKTFRESIQDYSDEMWQIIYENIRKEEGFQQVLLDMARTSSSTKKDKNNRCVFWVLDCLYGNRRRDENVDDDNQQQQRRTMYLDPNLLLCKSRPLLNEAIARNNEALIEKLLFDIFPVSENDENENETVLLLDVNTKNSTDAYTFRTHSALSIACQVAAYDKGGSSNLFRFYRNLLLRGASIERFDQNDPDNIRDGSIFRAFFAESIELKQDDHHGDDKSHSKFNLSFKYPKLAKLMLQNTFIKSNIPLINTQQKAVPPREPLLFIIFHQMKKEYEKLITRTNTNDDDEHFRSFLEEKYSLLIDLFYDRRSDYFAINEIVNVTQVFASPSNYRARGHITTEIRSPAFWCVGNGMSPDFLRRILNHSRKSNLRHHGKDYPYFYELNHQSTFSVRTFSSTKGQQGKKKLAATFDVETFIKKEQQANRNNNENKSAVVEEISLNAFELAILLKRIDLMKVMLEEGRVQLMRALGGKPKAETMYAFAERHLVANYDNNNSNDNDNDQVAQAILNLIADHLASSTSSYENDDPKSMKLFSREKELDDLMQRAVELQESASVFRAVAH